MQSNLFILLLFSVVQLIPVLADSGNLAEFSEDKEKKLNTSDTAKISNFVDANQFKYANLQRVTMDGSLPFEDTDINPVPFYVFTGSLTTLFILQHQLQLNTIWKEQGDFKVFEDGQYALYADKAGHLFGTYYTGYLMSEALMMTGLSWEAATVWGGLAGLAYTSYVEILDGYGINWGFSPSDMYMNVAGAAFFIGQYYWPYLQNFTPKFIYMPANWYGEEMRVPAEFFIDDYSSHTLHMNVNVHNMLPLSMKDYWPEWLELSFGYAARGICNEFDNPACKEGKVDFGDGYYGEPRFVVALDYNLTKILPDGHYLWNWFKQSIMYFKLPSPAIEFGPTTRVFLMYPFHF